MLALLITALWLGGTGAALAHGGGTPRLTGAEAGPYRLYAWTTPEPLRAGEIHVTVGVTQVDAQGIERAVTDAAVTVTFIAETGARAGVTLRPEIASGTGGVYYEADTAASLDGPYRVQVAAQGAAGHGGAEFSVVALPAGGNLWGWALAAVTILAAGSAAWFALRRVRRPAQAGAQARVNRKPV